MNRTRKLGLLGALYLAQGLPYGFQAQALPVYLRQQGVELEQIGYLGALALPWSLKALWAPFVDRWGSARLGRRKSWILPLQGLLSLCCLAAAALPPERIGVLLLLVFLMNLLAATQDVAVDGLAVELLEREELGLGNAAQVVGYKTGMLLSGGVLVWWCGGQGWSSLFLVLAALFLLVLVVAALFREPAAAPAAERERRRLAEILRVLWAAVRLPGGVTLLLFLVCYKTGEALVDPMFRPFLSDLGLTPDTIGKLVGSYGMIASLLGSLLGGLLAGRVSFARALLAAILLRTLAMLGQWWLAAGPRPGEGAIALVTCLEHLGGGALTVVTFALMMARVDRRIGATHYTLLATVEVLGKGLPGLGSGHLAKALGYPGLFLLGTGVSLLPLALLPLLAGHAHEPGPAPQEEAPAQ